MSEVNSRSKDRLFRFIFGQEANKAWTLSLYNAINETHYDDPDDIEITTVEDAVYMGIKNDLSFLIADTMNLYEHQSTCNQNMPVRMLIYAGMLFSKYIENERNKINLYSSRQQMLPAPKLVCFYNGLREQPDQTVLSLKTAFREGAESDIDVRVTMLNINFGRNEALLNACRPLRDYAQFIADVRETIDRGTSAEDAVAEAIEHLDDSSPIKSFLLSNKAEVKRMCITEYDEVKTMNMFREEGRVEGREEGADRLGRLITLLIEQNRQNDILRVSTDRAYRQQLFQEFQIA